MDEFEYQIRAEQEEREGKSKEESSTNKTYIDPSDGTVYEWDEKRNGWFPKVCKLHPYTYILASRAITIDRQRFFSSLSSSIWIPNSSI